MTRARRSTEARVVPSLSAVVPSLFQLPATLLSCKLFKGNLPPDAQDPEQESLQPLISRIIVVRVVALCIQPYFQPCC